VLINVHVDDESKSSRLFTAVRIAFEKSLAQIRMRGKVRAVLSEARTALVVYCRVTSRHKHAPFGDDKMSGMSCCILGRPQRYSSSLSQNHHHKKQQFTYPISSHRQTGSKRLIPCGTETFEMRYQSPMAEASIPYETRWYASAATTRTA
jgi:hypothetical protein